eukprot:TRINITY_DN6252_c0_g1_i6.p1 TRINITY_DN6252_c0_g1~~TRINITY_DN6252_c0_g1_i6.p1  ORF type:complete len:985 (+),score=244.76 TRINITY_DN6252_c0_g1_i6:68-3022(+)
MPAGASPPSQRTPQRRSTPSQRRTAGAAPRTPRASPPASRTPTPVRTARWRRPVPLPGASVAPKVSTPGRRRPSPQRPPAQQQRRVPQHTSPSPRRQHPQRSAQSPPQRRSSASPVRRQPPRRAAGATLRRAEAHAAGSSEPHRSPARRNPRRPAVSAASPARPRPSLPEVRSSYPFLPLPVIRRPLDGSPTVERRRVEVTPVPQLQRHLNPLMDGWRAVQGGEGQRRHSWSATSAEGDHSPPPEGEGPEVSPVQSPAVGSRDEQSPDPPQTTHQPPEQQPAEQQPQQQPPEQQPEQPPEQQPQQLPEQPEQQQPQQPQQQPEQQPEQPEPDKKPDITSPEHAPADEVGAFEASDLGPQMEVVELGRREPLIAAPAEGSVLMSPSVGQEDPREKSVFSPTRPMLAGSSSGDLAPQIEILGASDRPGGQANGPAWRSPPGRLPALFAPENDSSVFGSPVRQQTLCTVVDGSDPESSPAGHSPHAVAFPPPGGSPSTGLKSSPSILFQMSCSPASRRSSMDGSRMHRPTFSSVRTRGRSVRAPNPRNLESGPQTPKSRNRSGSPSEHMSHMSQGSRFQERPRVCYPAGQTALVCATVRGIVMPPSARGGGWFGDEREGEWQYAVPGVRLDWRSVPRRIVSDRSGLTCPVLCDWVGYLLRLVPVGGGTPGSSLEVSWPLNIAAQTVLRLAHVPQAPAFNVECRRRSAMAAASMRRDPYQSVGRTQSFAAAPPEATVLELTERRLKLKRKVGTATVVQARMGRDPVRCVLSNDPLCFTLDGMPGGEPWLVRVPEACGRAGRDLIVLTVRVWAAVSDPNLCSTMLGEPFSRVWQHQGGVRRIRDTVDMRLSTPREDAVRAALERAPTVMRRTAPGERTDREEARRALSTLISTVRSLRSAPPGRRAALWEIARAELPQAAPQAQAKYDSSEDSDLPGGDVSPEPDAKLLAEAKEQFELAGMTTRQLAEVSYRYPEASFYGTPAALLAGQ